MKTVDQRKKMIYYTGRGLGLTGDLDSGHQELIWLAIHLKGNSLARSMDGSKLELDSNILILTQQFSPTMESRRGSGTILGARAIPSGAFFSMSDVLGCYTKSISSRAITRSQSIIVTAIAR